MSEHENSKKINDSLDNPIDICIYKLADIVSPFFYELGFSPNMITFIGLITGLISAYFVYTNNILFALIFLWISYFLDALDGHLARKYNMQTEFGGYFDHIRDVLVFGFVCLLIVYKSQNRLLNLFIICLFFGFNLLHVSCQELNSKFPDNNDVLQNLTFCPKKRLVKYTRFFGSGTLMLVISILMSRLSYI